MRSSPICRCRACPGFDCAREMLAIRPDLPIVLTSGYVRPEDEALAREIGIRAVCSKPPR